MILKDVGKSTVYQKYLTLVYNIFFIKIEIFIDLMLIFAMFLFNQMSCQNFINKT